MPSPPVLTKPFSKNLRSLLEHGHKKVVQATRAAITEAGMEGEIRSLPRTKHGETRADVEKYDLADGFRLIVQLVDPTRRSRAFLFVGSHDDADRWLDNHKNYKWVRRDTDGVLEFVQVTGGETNVHIPADRLDLDTPEDLRKLPLLRYLSEAEFARIGLPADIAEVVRGVSAEDWESDADGILDKLSTSLDHATTGLVIDLLHHAHNNEHDALHARMALLTGAAAELVDTQVASAMLESTETLISLEDLDLEEFWTNARRMADWMLFVHPEQKKVADRNFAGPARLRGVSGSGKTSVLVHRARFLAKKYREPIYLVTLTESMRKLLAQLVADLCGLEGRWISCMTMASLAKEVASKRGPVRLIRDDEQLQLFRDAAERVRSHGDFARTPFASMPMDVLDAFVREEIRYVRNRLLDTDLEQYVDAKAFKRRGRGTALPETSRRVVLESIRYYLRELARMSVTDHEGIVIAALDAIEADASISPPVRCILADEVQDLSQLELALLSRLRMPSGSTVGTAEDGLFLVGDGAQTIYRRGFTLSRLGIDVNNRSFVLRKNYRNTHEVLKAAFLLVAKYEFADVDEENLASPSAPEYAKRHGRRPLIIRCRKTWDEATAVSLRIRSLIEMGYLPGQICVLAPSQKMRGEAKEAFERDGVYWTELRDDVDYESDRVKISTIESAKGHEFGAVFIMGCVEGVLPHFETPQEEMSREASRLYVGMTRARDVLVLTYSPTPTRAASRFLEVIQPECDEASFEDGQFRTLS